MTQKKSTVALLTTDNLHGHVTDDELLLAPLAERGWDAEFVSWRAETRWQNYAAVVIRSPWDYTDSPQQFAATLSAIAGAGTALANSLPLVRWNLDKSYLRDLSRAAVPVVPTRWLTELGPQDLERAFADFGCPELVLKPQLGASARDTYRLRPGEVDRSMLARFHARPCMLQPFLPEVVSAGEYSLFYFSGELSHVICKRPAAGDFRVQEEHGGSLHPVAADSAMVELAEMVMAQLDEQPLYARVDMVRTGSGLCLMELELVEPSLYLRLSDHAPGRLAGAIDRWLSAEK